MVEAIHLTGEFNNPTSLKGNYIILNCDGQQFFHKKELYESGKTWSAELVK